MSTSFFRGQETYVIYAEDSAFGTAGTPGGTDYVDKVSSFTASITNNAIRVHGIGEGRNATKVVNGILDVNGSLEWELTDRSFLQYCFVGIWQGSDGNSHDDAFELAEKDQIGYEAGQVKTLTFEVGSEGGTTDDVLTYDGIVINNFTLTATVGETIKCSADWVCRTVTSSTTVESYTPPTERPFTFVDGSVDIGTDAVFTVSNVTLTVAQNMFIYRSLGSRLINQPVTGIRRYDFTLTLKMNSNDTADTMSAIELRELFFGSTGATTPNDTATNTALGTLKVKLSEGATSGDRQLWFEFENGYLESWSKPVELEAGVFEVTVNGFCLAGLADGTDQIPCRYWTIT